MDAFVSRKKRRVSSPPKSTKEISDLTVPDDNESTDFKLAILSSLHSHLDQQILLNLLLSHDGSVAEVTAFLNAPVLPQFPKTSSSVGYQSSLSGFSRATAAAAGQGQKLLSRKGKTLYLFSPDDVAKHTPCSIIHNFLPVEEANSLLRELLLEVPTFERMTFKLFDNVVTSPHTASFYVEGLEELERQKTQYIYNGDTLTDVRQLLPQMKSVSPKVEIAVNEAIRARIKSHYPNQQKLRFQSGKAWTPNAAFVNCYSGGAESVGYHSDQLTYLGPRAVIGSLSLGVAREFRVRRIVPQDSSEEGLGDGKIKVRAKSKAESDLEGQISIHLPHNSLLVMHAEMQEEWKHSIAPAAAIDPHPIAGNRRINITYRDYKDNLHPHFTPKCRCNIPTVLRVVQRKKENLGRYFWMCHAGNVPGKTSCTFFEWAEFDDDGNPIWIK